MITERTWSQLVSPRAHGDVIATRLRPDLPFNLFAVVDSGSGDRFIVLKCRRALSIGSGSLPRGHGFNVDIVATPADSEGSRNLQLRLTDRSFADVFNVIANDILESLTGVQDEAAAAESFLARIRQWQSFLEQLPKAGLSELAQQGLFGELWFLDKFLLPEIGPSSAIRAWAGPKALAKDFHLSRLAVEVKASASKQHTRFAVSNEMQLDTTTVGGLFIFGLFLERVENAGMSLPELVGKLRGSLLTGDLEASVRFAGLLLQSGYADPDAIRYTARYVVKDERFFEVRDDFPRIVPADLRRGVGEVRYTILVSECDRYRVDDDTVRQLIRARS